MGRTLGLGRVGSLGGFPGACISCNAGGDGGGEAGVFAFASLKRAGRFPLAGKNEEPLWLLGEAGC